MKRIGLLLGIFLIGAMLFACAPRAMPAAPVEGKPVELAAPVAKTGWEIKWEKILQEVKREGKVVVYASTGAAGARDVMIKNMKQKYGIELEMIVGRGAEISQKIMSETKAGLHLADVYVGGPTTIVTVFIPSGAFDPIEKVLILPEVYETKYWRGSELPYFESGKYALRMSAPAGDILAINTSLVNPEEMTSFMDLVNPKWKGKIMMNDPSTTGSGQSFFYFVGIKIMNLDFMRQLAKQEPVILRDQRLMTEWLARGKYAIITGPLPEPVLEYKKEGAPIMLISHMKEGGWLSPTAGHIALMNKAPRPNAAAVFINWLLSRDGQAIWSSVQNEPSMRIDVPTEGIEPSRIPDPAKHYFGEDEEASWKKAESSPLAKEIFNIR